MTKQWCILYSVQWIDKFFKDFGTLLSMLCWRCPQEKGKTALRTTGSTRIENLQWMSSGFVGWLLLFFIDLFWFCFWCLFIIYLCYFVILEFKVPAHWVERDDQKLQYRFNWRRVWVFQFYEYQGFDFESMILLLL